jgi:hypothetical protein
MVVSLATYSANIARAGSETVQLYPSCMKEQGRRNFENHQRTLKKYTVNYICTLYRDFIDRGPRFLVVFILDNPPPITITALISFHFDG